MVGQKHLVPCRCTLPQFKNFKEPPRHQFVVFSVINDDDSVVPKHVKCNNCGVIHRVDGICRSEILNKEDTSVSMCIEDVKACLPEKIVAVLDRHNTSLPDWEHAKFIIDNSRWGEFVVLSSESDGDFDSGKMIQFLGENLFRIENFSRRTTV